jgi:tetratricopeptide (TPR) repeat protein
MPRVFFVHSRNRIVTKLLAVPIVLLVALSCDVDRGPLTNASEMFDRGVSLFNDKSYQQAEVFLTQAVIAYEREKDFARAAEVYSYLSRISLAEGEFRNAVEQARTAFEDGKQANDFRGQARYHLLLGEIDEEEGEYRDALNHYESALSLSSAFDDRPSKADAEMRKGSVLNRMNRWDEALKVFQAPLEYYKSTGEDNRYTEAFLGIGESYFKERRFGEAMSSLSQAQKSIDPSDDPVLDAKLHLLLGNVARAMNDGNNALRYFRDGVNNLRARRGSKEYETLLLFSIGTVYNESARYDEAKKFYTEAVASARSAGDRLAENYLYLFVAQVTERQIPANQKNFLLDKRVQSYLQIAQRFEDCEHKTGEAYAFIQAGLLYQSVGRLPEAREMFERGVDLEEQRIGEYLDPDLHLPYQVELGIDQDREGWYRRLAGVLVQLRRNEDALLTLDRARAQMASEMLTRVNVTVRNVGLQKQIETLQTNYQQCRTLQLELSSLASRSQSAVTPQALSQLKLQSTRLLEEVKKEAASVATAYPNYGPLTGIGMNVDLGSLQNHIPAGTILVTFLPLQDYLYTFVLSRNDFEVKSVAVGRERLLGMVSEYERLMKDPNVYAGAAGEASLPAMTRFANLSTQLYDLLIRPFDSMLDRSLIIIAGRDFENFPFQTIEQETKNNSRYLIELTSVDYLTSLASLEFRTTTATRIRTVTALGNPTGKNWSIDYELRDIRSFFKEASVLLGFEATFTNLKVNRSDILQIATDYKNDPGNAPFGSVAFSDGETLEESIDVPFENLTQLSASPVIILSNTFGQGTGLTPLHASLLRVNGTSDVFYNAWGAERKAAKFFSEFFYTQLANGLAPGDAYRQALLNLIRTSDVNHPFAWGQFFHYGIG